MASIKWARLIGGVLIGALVAGLTIFLIETIGHSLFPPPAGTDVGDPADLARLFETMPVGAQVLVLIGWVLGTVAGGVVAIRIGRHPIAPWTVAALIVAGALYSFATIPHPWWMIVGGVALPPLAALLVQRRARPTTAPS